MQKEILLRIGVNVDKNGEVVIADGRDHDDKTAYIFYLDEVGA